MIPYANRGRLMLLTKRAGHYKEPRNQSKLVQPVTNVKGGSTRLSHQVMISFEFFFRRKRVPDILEN